MDAKALLDSLDVGVLAMAPDWTIAAWCAAAGPTPALVLSPDGQILDANPEGAKLLGGADATALRGRGLAEWAPASQQDMLAAGLRNAVTGRQDVALSFEFAGEPAREVRAVVVNVDPVRAAPKLLFLALDVSRE